MNRNIIDQDRLTKIDNSVVKFYNEANSYESIKSLIKWLYNEKITSEDINIILSLKSIKPIEYDFEIPSNLRNVTISVEPPKEAPSKLIENSTAPYMPNVERMKCQDCNSTNTAWCHNDDYCQDCGSRNVW